MSRIFRIRPLTRRRLAWLVAFMLLWQQVAVAAYVCATVPAAIGTVATMTASSSMAAMGDSCADMRGAPVTPLCQQHCQPDHAAQVDIRAASVPLNTLPALPPMSLSVAVMALPSERAFVRLDRLRTPPPIPRLLFCSLLI